MYARIVREKKGLVPISQEQAAGLIGTYRVLAAIQAEMPGSVPRAVPFVATKPPAQVLVLTANDLDVTENLNPQTAAAIVRTQPVRLTRAELPLTFDVVSLSRGAAEEETTIAQTQVGEMAEDNDQRDEDDGGGEADE